MGVTRLLVVFMVLLSLAMVGEVLAKRMRLPIGAVLVVFGFAGSELMIGLGYDTGLRWQNFRELILYLFLPVIVFASALQTDVVSFRRHWPVVLSLSVPFLLLAGVLCAALLYYLIGHQTGFPWIAAMIATSLFVATDPLVVSEILDRHRIKPPVTTLVDGEGLFSDALAIALFASLMAYAVSVDQAKGEWLGMAIAQFLWVLGAGVAVGGVCAWLLARTVWHKVTGVERGMLSLAFVYAVYLVTELLLNASGVIALMVAGLILGSSFRRSQPDQEAEFILLLWRFLSRIAYHLIFLLVGATITLSMFTQRWLAMLMAIAATLLARGLIVYALLPLQTHWTKDRRLNAPQLAVLYTGGVRGAVTLALALSIPTSLSYWWTIQSMAYGVVLFSLFIQAPLVELLATKYRKRL